LPGGLPPPELTSFPDRSRTLGAVSILNQKTLVGKMARKDFAETLLNGVERKI